MSIPNSLNGSTAPRQAEAQDHRLTIRSGSQDQSFLEVLRRSASDLDWTYEALGSHMGKDESFIRKVLGGEKPMPEGFFDGLPHQVRGEFYAKQAEAHGHYVVSPAETAEDGARALIVGVLSAFAAFRLPTKAQQMARASVPNNQTKKVG
jgi:hypothetical protein